MSLIIPDVLTAAEVTESRRLLQAAEWTDGRVTAGHQGAHVKNNTQLPEGSVAGRTVGEIIVNALRKNALFMSAALPLHVLPPMFNRYATNQTFGSHIDGAVRTLPNGQRIRTDLSCTLFLSAPDEYDGGELVIESVGEPKRIKLPAGHMILYQSDSVHHVAPVTRGVRLGSFFWLQSMIRDNAQRSLLFDMDVALQRLGAKQPTDPSIIQLTGVYHNLLRQWVDL